MTLAAATVLLVTTAAAAVWDLRSRRVPNWLTFFGLVAGSALALWHQPFWPTVLFPLTGSILGMVIPVFAESFGWIGQIGGGDIKLLGAVGALSGPEDLIPILLGTYFILEALPPKIMRPAAPVIFAATVFTVGCKLLSQC